jgi:hypothetical protein
MTQRHHTRVKNCKGGEMMGINIGYSPKSSLAFIIAIALIALLIANMMQPAEPAVAQKLESTFTPLLYLGLFIWVPFVLIALFRNLRRL